MNLFSKTIDKLSAAIKYCVSGVWDDPRRTTKVRLVRTLNLSVNSFLDRGLQIKSMALTYSTILSLVPALALLVAIGRGFGLQNSLQEQLFNFFPSQKQAISAALGFVDSYLNEATQGVFVGIGLIFLLWTVISLLSYIEDAFNTIWDVQKERSIFQKITDYIAICLLIPILMICSSGVSIFMSTTIQDNLHLPFLTPLVNISLEAAPVVLCWLAFSLSFLLIPNTKVSIKYAAISGAICAVAFQILQMLFLNGQIYVSKYNAIYGSFAFLPLMLIWLQFSWLLILSGCVLTYSLQNVFTFNFNGNSNSLSINGVHSIALIVMAVISKRFINQEKPLTMVEIASEYNLPIRVVTRIIEKLHKAGLIYTVKLKDGVDGETPALEVKDLTVGEFFKRFDNEGTNEFIPDFENIFAEMMAITDPLTQKCYDEFSTLILHEIPLPSPERIHEILLRDAAAAKSSADENK